MRMNKFGLLVTSLLMCITSCTNDLDTNMVNDTIGLLNPNLVVTTVYPGVDEVSDIQVIKSGKGMVDAQVSLDVDESVLAKYNEENGTSYALMPSDCYTLILKQLSFSASDYQKAFTLQWNIEKLQSLLAQSTHYVVPLLMSVNSAGVDVDEGRLSTLLLPSLEAPSLSLENSGLFDGIMPTVNDEEDQEVYVKVRANFSNQTDMTYEVAVDPQLLLDYNGKNGTNFQILPENAYKLTSTRWTLPALVNESFFSFTFKNSALMQDKNNILFGDYVLPLKLVSSSTCDVNQSASFILYKISFQPSLIDKNGWTVLDYNTCSKEDEIAWVAALDWGPEKTIDGNPVTFWGSRWTTPKPLPYYFVYDMAAEHKVYKIGFDNPTGADAWRGNAKAGYVEYSVDNKNWTRLVDWITPNQAARSISMNVSTAEARYIRFVITEAYDSGLFASGGSQMNIAEFYVWGE